MLLASKNNYFTTQELPSAPAVKYIEVTDGLSISGYYLGCRKTPVLSYKKNWHSPSVMWHIFQTEAGIIGLKNWDDVDTFSTIDQIVGARCELAFREYSNDKSLKWTLRYDVEVTTVVDQNAVDIAGSRAMLGPTTPAFVMPNGAYLRYSVKVDPKKGHNNSWRVENTQHLEEHDPVEKRDRNSLYLWSSKTRQHAIAADFDTIPPGFESYEALIEYLKRHYNSGSVPRAIVFRSPSNKAKAIFVIELPKNEEMTHIIARAALLSILPDKLKYLLSKEYKLEQKNTDSKPSLDDSHGGLGTVFLSPSIVQIINTTLPSLLPFPFHLPYLSLVSNDTVLQDLKEAQASGITTKSFKIYDGAIPPQLIPFLNGRGKAPKEKFLRILLHSPSLAKPSGFDLPITKIAAEVGATHKSISNWRIELKNLGWLVCIDETVVMKQKAKTFVARGALLESIQEFNLKTFKELPPLPTIIADGDWESIYTTHRWHFVDGEKEFRAWFKSLPGSSLKDRPAKLEHAIDHNKRWKLHKERKKLK